ncbi:hypothetical protein BH24CHL4_BH24CHL4_10970 [soil metagenome]
MTSHDQAWPIRELGELIQIKHGYAFKGEFFSDSGPYVVLTPGNFFDDGGFKNKGCKEKFYTGEVPSDFILQEGDLLVAMTEQAEGLLGSSAIVPQSDYYLHNQRLGLVREFNPAEIDRRYLYFLFNTQGVRQQIRSTASGTKVRHTSPSRIYEVQVEIPPISTQRRIAGILSAYDDLIENNTRRIAILEEMAQRLYQEWFVHFRYPGHENVPLVDSELGPIPEGWEVKRVADAFEILGGGTPSTKDLSYWECGDIVWYSPTDLTSNGSMFISDSVKHITAEGLQRSSARLFPAYSVMMTSRATIGVTAVNTSPACTNQGFITCLTNEEFSVYAIYYWLQERRGEIQSLASGATFKEINRGTFKQLMVLLPDRVNRTRFEKVVTQLWGEIENLSSSVTNLAQARDLLLPKLVSGIIQVKEFEDTWQAEPNTVSMELGDDPEMRSMGSFESVARTQSLGIERNISIDPRFAVAQMRHEITRHIAAMRNSLRALEDGTYQQRQAAGSNANLILFSVDKQIDIQAEGQRIMSSTMQATFRSFSEFIDRVLATRELTLGPVQLSRTLKSKEELDNWISSWIMSRAVEVGRDRTRPTPRKLREIGNHPQWLLDVTNGYFALRNTIEHHHSVSQSEFSVITYRVRATTESGMRDVQLFDHFEAGEIIETFWEKREQRIPKGVQITIAEQGVELTANSLVFVIGPAIVGTMAFPDASADQPEFPELIVELLEQEEFKA